MVKLSTNDIFDQMWGRYSPFTIGTDRLFHQLETLSSQQQQSYPPYNIVKKDDENFAIEIAVAGFGEEDLKVEKIKNELVVSGEIKGSDDETIHKGIATRKFKRTWVLADDVEVSNPSVRNGILYIPMVKVIPEEDKPQVLEFVDTKEFLSES